jgi:hypothetical protein
VAIAARALRIVFSFVNSFAAIACDAPGPPLGICLTRAASSLAPQGVRCQLSASGVVWWIDAQVTTDLAHKIITDLGMPRNRRNDDSTSG